MNLAPHDFTKPGRLTPEWQQKLSAWFRLGFALANKAWAKQLPFAVEASLLEVDVGHAKELLARLPEGVAGYRVLLAGASVPTFLILPRVMLLKLVGALLGDIESSTDDREMSLIEENLADYFLVQYWLPYFREAWPAPQAMTWELQPREANPQCSRAFGAEDVLLTMNWQMRGPWGEYSGVWLMHKKGLLAALGETAADFENVPANVVAARREAILNSLPLQLEVVLGTADVKLSQLSRLQVGDVVLLEQSSDADVIARAAGRALFHGKAGRQGSWKAVQVAALGE